MWPSAGVSPNHDKVLFYNLFDKDVTICQLAYVMLRVFYLRILFFAFGSLVTTLCNVKAALAQSYLNPNLEEHVAPKYSVAARVSKEGAWLYKRFALYRVPLDLGRKRI
jgi:hypothetical protein